MALPRPRDGQPSAPRQQQQQRTPGRVAKALAPAIVRAADGLSRWTTRVLGVEATVGRERISEKELRQLIAVNTALDPDERHIIGKALARATAMVREVMVPRTEVCFLQLGMSVRAAIEFARHNRHTRFPVTDGSDDDVVGFVHLRDLLWEREQERGIGDLTRVIKRLPGSKPVLAALSEMRRERHTIAVVVDEYGGTAGVVTLEDLIEELVGEIHDEYDETPAPATILGAPSEMDGILNLSDFAERTGVSLPDGPYETVAGFIMSSLGRLPVVGDIVNVETHTLTVTKVDGRRVARIRLTPTE